jgi:hypothetical protein
MNAVLAFPFQLNVGAAAVAAFPLPTPTLPTRTAGGRQSQVMKAILLCALLLGSVAFAGQLTVNDGRAKYAAVNPFPGSTKHANIVNASADPFRKVGEASVDLLPLFRYYELEGSRKQPAKRPLGNWVLLQGTVIQAKAGDGILVRKDSRDGVGKIVFVRRFPFSVVDDDYFVAFVCSSGTHEYTAVTGATKKVEAFDHGTIIRGKEAEDMAAKNGAGAISASEATAAQDAAAEKKRKTDEAVKKFRAEQATKGEAGK